MVLCGYKEQINLLSRLSSFEVDMSYKRIRSKDMNEVLFATFLKLDLIVTQAGRQQLDRSVGSTVGCVMADAFPCLYYLDNRYYDLEAEWKLARI
jgi:hypothetical protein